LSQEAGVRRGRAKKVPPRVIHDELLSSPTAQLTQLKLQKMMCRQRA
jgi:hypothetical protein